MAWSKDYGLEARNAAQQAEQKITEIDGKITEVEALVDQNTANFLAAVTNESDLATTYPTPQKGDTVRITSEARTVRYDGNTWVTTDVYNPTAIDNISAQLDETDTRLTSQLAEKVGGARKATMDDLEQDVKTALTGGAVAVVGTGAVGTVNVQTKAITPELTSFIEVASDNQFDKSNVLVNTSIDNLGNVHAATGWNTSGFIPVFPGENITFTRVSKYAYYSADKVFSTIANTDAVTDTVTLTIPDGIYSLRVLVLNSQLNLAQVNRGATLLPYDDYTIRVKGMKEPDLSALDTILSTITTENESWVI